MYDAGMNLSASHSGFLLSVLLGVAALCGAPGCGCSPGQQDRSRGPDGIMRGAEAVRIDRERSRAVLLLHGFSSCPADFVGLYEPLDEAGWDVYAPRLPGHGTSPADLARVSAGQIMEAAREHYSEMRQRYETVALAGFSMGGSIATGLAGSRPPDALVLVSPFYGITYRWYYLLPVEWWFSIVSPVLDSVPSQKNVNRPEGKKTIVGYERFPMPAIEMLYTLKDNVLSRTKDGSLTCPVLLVYSAGDEAASPESMKKVLGRLASGDFRERRFTRSNHYVLHDYDRHAAIRSIVRFLTQKTRDGG